MKMSMRDKKILLMFLGLLAFVAAYFLIYSPQMDVAANLETENESLQERLNTLLDMEEKKEFYQEEVGRMGVEIEKYCKSFPEKVKEEDGILFADAMEKKVNVQISNIGLGERELISTISGEAAAEGQTDETLMEQGNQATQDNIDEIEGNTGEKAEKKEADKTAQEALADASWSPNLYRNQVTCQFSVDYEGLKKAVLYLTQQKGRMTMDSISTSFDSATGNLSGTMVINLFSMTNTGETYTEPNAGNVSLGTDNIFGSLGAVSEQQKKK